MRKGKRRAAQIVGQREAQAIASNLGRDTRQTRSRRHLTQAAIGKVVGLSQSEMSRLELGGGAGTSIATWVAIGIALQRPISIAFSRDVAQPLNDAGHLEAQELVLRLATAAGWRAAFEARTETTLSQLSTDLVLERDRDRVLVEIWNRLDDLGASVRSTDRKLAAAPPGSKCLWLLVDTAANHAIVRRYPAVFRARFPSSSTHWVEAIAAGRPRPRQAGLAWVDLRAGTLRPVRLRG